MSGPGTISDPGRTSLRQILYLRDYYDYAKFLQNGDPDTGTSSPLDQEISALFRDQGIFVALKTVLDRFNSDQADVQAAIRLFDLPAGERITARDLAAAALDQRAGRADLRSALLRVKKSGLTAQGKALISQILYIRDLFDYNNFLKEGDPGQGIASPLDPAVIALFRDQGIFTALKTVLDSFNGNQADVQAAIELFNLPAGVNVKAKELGAAWLQELNDSADLQAALVRLDTLPPEFKLEQEAFDHISQGHFRSALKIYLRLQKDFPNFQPDRISEQVDFCRESVSDTPEKLRAAVREKLGHLLSQMGKQKFIEASGTVTFHLKVSNTGELLPGTAPDKEWIYFSADFKLVDNQGTSLDRPDFVSIVLLPIFSNEAAVPSIAEKTVSGSFYYKVEVTKVASKIALVDVSPVKKAPAGLNYNRVNSQSQVWLPAASASEQPAAGKAPVPSITHNTAKSAYKEQDKTDYVNESLEKAFLDDLRRDLGQDGKMMCLSGAAVVTVQIGTDGSVAVTGIKIKSQFAVTFTKRTDDDIMARIRNSLNNVVLSASLCGDKPLIHSLIIGSQQ